MAVHEHSIASYRKLDATTITAAIFDVYRTSEVPMTDREVAECLGHEDLNIVRPKITMLLRTGRCSAVGMKHDQKTDRDVRIVTLYNRATTTTTPSPSRIPRALLTALLCSIQEYTQSRDAEAWEGVQHDLDAIGQYGTTLTDKQP